MGSHYEVLFNLVLRHHADKSPEPIDELIRREEQATIDRKVAKAVRTLRKLDPQLCAA